MEKRAVDVARIAFDNSKSPMETSLALILTLPIEFGGFGLPRPELNRNIDVSGWRGILSDRNTICTDMWWEDHGVALEYDSFSFHGKQGEARRTSDAIRSNILASLGCCTLRVTPGVIRTLEGTALLVRQIAVRLNVESRQPTRRRDAAAHKALQGAHAQSIRCARRITSFTCGELVRRYHPTAR